MDSTWMCQPSRCEAGSSSGQGSVTARACFANWEAAAAVPELQRQKAITQHCMASEWAACLWGKMCLLQAWPRGQQRARGTPADNTHGLSATFMPQTYGT